MRNEGTSKRGENRPLLTLPESLHANVVRDLLMILDNPLEPNQTSDDVVEFKRNWLRKSVMSKYSDPTTTPPHIRKSAAIEKWMRMESRNRVTNERLLFDECQFGTVSSDEILNFAALVVKQVIGEEPPEDVLLGGFSNGASTRVKRGGPAIAQKFMGEAHVTTEGLEVFKTRVLPYYPLWLTEYVDGSLNPVTVLGSVLFTVPKNSDIDRVACKEPELNMFMQRGVGNYIRTALKRRGIDLNDQSKNQRLALEGSTTRKLATLDLSSASDLISTTLVNRLLPASWFILLDQIRVKRTMVGDEWHELNMFSSMGNGFTFELESLLFYSLACAINRCWKVRGRISVYGDDIITPVSIAPMYQRVFAWMGFIVNSKKSFWSGHFRESCGKHYYRGCDVTPFYLREKIAQLPDLILFLNNLRVWATESDVSVDFWDYRFNTLWSHYSRKVPRFLRGGRNPADKGALVTLDEPSHRLAPASRSGKSPDLGAYLQWLHAHGGRCETVTVRSDIGDLAPVWKRMLAFHWAELALSRETIPTSKFTLEIGLRAIPNRTWNARLCTSLYWYTELCRETDAEQTS